ncbi:MAG: hypothetical protein U0792_23985 [Gemmataceae bacterium]
MAWGLRLLLVPLLLILYLTFSAEGLRNFSDVAATPLYKTGLWPLTVLGQFAETRKVDVAHLMCGLLMIVVWVSWEMLIEMYVNKKTLNNLWRIIWIAGAVVLVGDAVLFWNGLAHSGLLGGSGVFSATVITAVYVAMMMLIATWVLMLEGKIK